MLTRMQSKMKPPVGVPIHPSHPLARGLAGCWLLNEGAGSTAHDASGHHHDGVFSGNSAWSRGPLGCTVEFDGADDWITMGDCLDPGTEDITLLALVNYTVTQQPNGNHYGGIAGKGYLDGSSKGYGLYVDANNRIAWQIRSLSSVSGVASNSALNDGAWHLAIGICDRDSSSGTRLYIDAVPQNATGNPTALDGIDIDGAAALAIGSRQADAGTWYWDFSGRVAMVCVWKRILVEAEIRRLQQNPFEMFARRRSISTIASGVGSIVSCTGASAATTSLSATMRVARNVTGVTAATTSVNGSLGETNIISLSGTVYGFSTLHAALSVSSAESPVHTASQTDRAWLSEALLNGATHTAFLLGTALAQGWFWTRRTGCTAVYRGACLAQVDLARILYVGEPDAQDIPLPACLSHVPGSTYCYLIRRFDSCGRQEATWQAATVLRIASDGQRAPSRPNPVHGLTSKPAGPANMQLLWFYCPLDQEIAPGQFRVYRSGVTGTGDLSTPIAVVRYDGRRFYGLQCAGPTDDADTFVVRAANAAGTEGESSTAVIRRVESPALEPPVILTAASF